MDTDLVPQLRCDKQGAPRTAGDTDEQRQTEDTDGTASEEQQAHNRQNRCQRGENGSCRRSLQRFIYDFTIFRFRRCRKLAPLHLITDTVKDDNRVVNGISDHRQQHGDDFRINLQTENRTGRKHEERPV